MATTPENPPWWSNLISLPVGLVVGGFLGAYIYKRAMTGTPGTGSSGGMGWLTTSLLYIPHALILFGVIADMLTYEGVYWIPSFITLVITPVMHKLLGYMWKGAFDIVGSFSTSPTPAPAMSGGGEVIGRTVASSFVSYTGCDLQGFGWAHSAYGGQTLAIIATFFSYFVFDLSNNGKPGSTIAPTLFWAIFYISQYMLSGDCRLQGDPTVGRVWQFILPLIEGLFVGGVSYSVVQGFYPSFLPSAAISPFPRLTPSDLRDGKYDKDGNPWVCVNGTCYPDMSTAESRTAFAQMAAANTGNGEAAKSANCPASA